ncbi:MAG: hypothetical protein HY537_03370 [Deltaproteobacteria bacterium]|nr:hypothetical protein [Deltaproteobacteria bacterium]
MKRKAWLPILWIVALQSHAVFAGGVGCFMTSEYPKLHEAVVTKNIDEIRLLGTEIERVLHQELEYCQHGSYCYWGAEEVPHLGNIINALHNLVTATSPSEITIHYTALSQGMYGFCRIVRWWQDMWTLYKCHDVTPGVWVQPEHETMTIPYDGHNCGSVPWPAQRD